MSSHNYLWYLMPCPYCNNVMLNFTEMLLVLHGNLSKKLHIGETFVQASYRSNLKASLITLTNRAYSVNNMLKLNNSIVLCAISIK